MVTMSLLKSARYYFPIVGHYSESKCHENLILSSDMKNAKAISVWVNVNIVMRYSLINDSIHEFKNSIAATKLKTRCSS